MKKLIALIVIFVCVGSALSAQFSVGGGGILDFGIHSWTTKIDGKKETKDDLSGSETNIQYGAMGFFDATYIEADVGVLFYNKSETIEKITYKYSTTSLMFGLLGKYPIDLGGFTIFPLAGFQFFIPLSQKSKSDDNDWVKNEFSGDNNSRMDNSNLWLRVGGGGDINITPQVYVRPSLLWGFRFKHSFEKDALDITNVDKDKKSYSYFDQSFQLRVTAGFKF
jgi:hypothetical protein